MVHYAKPDEIDTARESIREIVGEVVVLEKEFHVFAYTKFNENMGFKSGAENPGPELYLDPIRLK